MNEHLIDDWTDWLTAGQLSPKTIYLRRCLVRIFADDHDLATATGRDIGRHIADRPGGAWSKSSHLASLRSFYRWAHLSDLIVADPTRLVHAIRVPDGVPKPVPEDVLAAGLVRADPITERMLMLGAYAGLRRAEIAGLHADHVSATHLTITGKGGRTRRIPIHPRLRPLLVFDGWAFPSPRDPTRHVSGEYVAQRVTAATPGYTAHCLRHRAATQWYRVSHDIRAVQALLGHSSPTTTARYVQVEQDAMTAAVLAVT